MNDPYKILGITTNTSIEGIKSAFRRLASIHHPDKGGDAETFRSAREAYELAMGKAGKAINTPIIHDQYHLPLQIAQCFKGMTLDTVEIRGVIHAIDPICIVPGIQHGDVIDTVKINNRHVQLVANLKQDAQYSISTHSGDTRGIGDITQHVLISPFLMISGGFLGVLCIDGETNLVRIPAGLEANGLIYVKSRGYWTDTRCKYRGDLYIRAIPDIKKLQDYDQFEMHRIKTLIKEYDNMLK